MDNTSNPEKPPKKPFFSPSCLLVGCLLIAPVLYLAVTTGPGFMRARAQGKLTACKKNLKDISGALRLYSEDHEQSYPKTLQELTPKYMKAIPPCPQSLDHGYKIATGTDAAGNDERVDRYYIVWCQGSAHHNLLKVNDYPRFSSTMGIIEKP